jgi:hypothetical protein
MMKIMHIKYPKGWTPLPAQVRLRGRVHPGCQDGWFKTNDEGSVTVVIIKVDENTRNVKITVSDSKGTLSHDEALAVVREFLPDEPQASVLKVGLEFEAVLTG